MSRVSDFGLSSGGQGRTMMRLKTLLGALTPPTTRRTWAKLFGIVMSAALVLGMVSTLTPTAQAAPTMPFTPRFSANDAGTIVAVGNNVLTCPVSEGNCAEAKRGEVFGSNNGYNMVFVDTDGDPSTSNSSMSRLDLPAGAKVLWAGLYWGGYATPQQSVGTSINRMSFRVPGSAYQTITARSDADAQFGPDMSIATQRPYQRFADVTELVSSAGSGEYWGADLALGTGSNAMGGWSLVVAYSAPGLPLRNLTVFDGFYDVGRSSYTLSVPVSGFETPRSGDVNTRLVMVAYEGDGGLTSTYLNDVVLSTEVSEENRFFNSRNDFNGASVATRNPADVNMFGYDIKNFDVKNVLPNGSTSTTFTFTSPNTNGPDIYYPGVLALAIDQNSPNFDSSTKTAVNLSGGTSNEAGDVIEYTIKHTNEGQDTAEHTIAEDVIPAGTEYVPGSLKLLSGPGFSTVTPVTDAAGDDLGEFTGTSVRLYLGTGASPTAGGTVELGASYGYSFQVKLTGAAAGKTITNEGTLDYVTGGLNIPVVYVTPAASTEVLSALTLTFAVSPVADLSDQGTWVTANGTDAYTGTVTVRDEANSPVSTLSLSDFDVTASSPAVNVSAVTNNQNGTYTVRFTSKVADAAVTASAVYKGVPLGSASPIPFKAGPPVIGPECEDPTRQGTHLAVDRNTAPVGESVNATALITDQWCNPVPDVTVSFTVDGSAEASPATMQTDADGMATIQVSDDVAETVGVRARIAEGEIKLSPQPVTFTASGLSYEYSSFTVSPVAVMGDQTTWVSADGSSAYTGVLVARDSNDKPMTDLALSDIAFTASTGAVVAVSSVVNNGDGTYSVKYTSKVADGSVTASVAYQSVQVGSALPIPFKAGPPVIGPVVCEDPTRQGTHLTVDPTVLPTGTSATAKALITDENCNVVEGAVVSFAATKSATVSAASMPTGADGVATVTVSDDVAETVDVSATILIDGLASPIAGSPTPVRFTGGVVDGSMSVLSVSDDSVLVADTVTATVTVKDGQGNAPLLPVTVAFSLTGEAVFADGVNSCVITTGDSCSVDFTDGFPETVVVNATLTYEGTTQAVGDGLGKSVVFNPGSASAATSTLVVDKTSTVVGTTITATATAYDDYGTKLAAGVVFEFTVSGSAAVAASCQTEASGSCQVSVTDTTAETVSLTGSLGGVQIGTGRQPADAALDSPKELTFTPGAPDAGNSFLVLEKTAAQLGEPVAATVTVKDAYGNPVPGITVTFGQDGNASFDSSSCVSLADGVCAVSLSDTVNETVNVSATIELAGVATHVKNSPTAVRFGHGPIDGVKSWLAVNPTTQTAGSPVSVSVNLADESGSPVDDLTAADFVMSGLADGLPGLVFSSWANMGGGVYTYTTTSPLVGTFTLSALVDGVLVDHGLDSSAPVRVTFVAGGVCVSNCTPVDPDNQTRFVLTKDGAPADGASADEITAYAYDTYGNPVAGAAVVVSDQTTGVLAGRLNPATATGTTSAEGIAVVSFTTTSAGTYTVAGTIGGLTPATAVQNPSFAPQGVSAAASTLVVAPVDNTVGDLARASITTRDANNNLVGGVPVSISGSDAELMIDGAASATCVTAALGAPGEGTCQVGVTSKIAGEYTVSATIGGVGVGGSPAPVRFAADVVCFDNCTPVVPGNLTRVEVTRDGAVADGVDIDQVSVYAYDRFGNPVAGAVVTSSAITPTLTVKTATATTSASGTAVLDYVSTVKGAAQARVMIDGVEPKNPAGASPVTMSFANGVADAGRSSVSIDPTTAQVVDSVFTITAQTKDATGNPVAGAVVTFTASDPAAVLSAASCAGDEDGVCTVTVTSVKAGTYQVSATIGVAGQPVEITGSPVSATFTAGPVCVQPGCVPDAGVPLTRVEVTTDGQPNDGLARDIATVWAYDKHGNPVAGAIVDSVPDPAVTVVRPIAPTGSDAQTTVGYTSWTAGAFPAAVSVQVAGGEWAQVPGSPVRLTFGAGKGDAGQSSFTVTPLVPGATVPLTVGTADANTYLVSATIKDALGDPAPGSVVSFAIAPNGPAWVGGLASCVADEDGTCSVSVSSTRAGAYAVTAALGADQIGSAQPATWKADEVCADDCAPVDPQLPLEQLSRVVVTTDNQRADGFAADVVTVYAFDQYGNPVQGVVAKPAAGTASALVPQSGIKGTDANGVTTIAYTSVVAGAHQAFIMVDLDDKVPAGSPVTLRFVPGEVDAEQSTLTVDRTEQVVGQAILATATARDAHANLVPGVSVTFGLDGSASFLSLARSGAGTCVTGDGTSGTTLGVCQIRITDTKTETVNLTATVPVGGVSTPITGSPQALTFTAGCVPGIDPGCVAGPEIDNDRRTQVKVTVDYQKAGGTIPDVATVKIFDLYGNPVDRAVTSTTADAELVIGAITRAGLGQYTIAYTTPVTHQVTYQAAVFIDGQPITFVPQPGSALETDAAGIAALSSPVVLHFVDATDPAAPVITSPKDGDVTNDEPVVVTGTGEPGATVEVTDGTGETVCTATVDQAGVWSCPADLPDGEHTLTATQTDPAGNTSPPSEPVTVTVDTTDPAAPVITSPKDGDVTKDKPVVVTGTGEPGATVEVTDGTGETVCTATVNQAGVWSCPAELPEGEHTLTATQTDPAGNTSPPSEPVTVTVDRTPPPAPVVDPTDGKKITGTSEPGTTVVLKDKNGTVIPGCENIVADADGRFSCTPTTPVDPGETITVTAVDEAGNTSEPTTVTVPETTDPAAPVITSPKDGDVTSDKPVIVTGTGDPGAAVKVTDETGKTVCTTTVGAGGTWSCAVDLPEGEHTLTATQTDPAGNTSPPSKPIGITVDRTPPPAPVVDPTDGKKITGTSEPGTTVVLKDKDGTVIPGCENVVAGTDGRFSCTPTTPVTPGETITVTAVDKSGNTSLPTTVTVVQPVTDLPTGGATINGSITGAASLAAIMLASGLVVLLAARRRNQAGEPITTR